MKKYDVQVTFYFKKWYKIKGFQKFFQQNALYASNLIVNVLYFYQMFDISNRKLSIIMSK